MQKSLLCGNMLLFESWTQITDMCTLQCENTVLDNVLENENPDGSDDKDADD